MNGAISFDNKSVILYNNSRESYCVIQGDDKWTIEKVPFKKPGTWEEHLIQSRERLFVFRLDDDVVSSGAIDAGLTVAERTSGGTWLEEKSIFKEDSLLGLDAVARPDGSAAIAWTNRKYDKIYYSEENGKGGWTKPEVITYENRVSPPSLFIDGAGRVTIAVAVLQSKADRIRRIELLQPTQGNGWKRETLGYVPWTLNGSPENGTTRIKTSTHNGQLTISLADWVWNDSAAITVFQAATANGSSVLPVQIWKDYSMSQPVFWNPNNGPLTIAWVNKNAKGETTIMASQYLSDAWSQPAVIINPPQKEWIANAQIVQAASSASLFWSTYKGDDNSSLSGSILSPDLKVQSQLNPILAPTSAIIPLAIAGRDNEVHLIWSQTRGLARAKFKDGELIAKEYPIAETKSYNAIAVDSDGYVHIVGVAKPGVSPQIVHIWESKSGWKTEVAFTAERWPAQPRIVVADSVVYITFMSLNDDYNKPSDIMVMKKEQDGRWTSPLSVGLMYRFADSSVFGFADRKDSLEVIWPGSYGKIPELPGGSYPLNAKTSGPYTFMTGISSGQAYDAASRKYVYWLEAKPLGNTELWYKIVRNK